MNRIKEFFKRSLPFLLLLLVVAGCADSPIDRSVANAELFNAGLLTLQIVVAAVMLFGLSSLLLVVVPGLTIIWLAALIYGILTGFDINSGLIFLAISVCMIFGNMVDQILMGARARKSGASWTGVLASMAAAFVFSLLFPPFGGLIAALVVLFAVETVRLKDWRKATDSTREMAVGCASGVLARFAIGLLMIALWILWVWLSGDWPF